MCHGVSVGARRNGRAECLCALSAHRRRYFLSARARAPRRTLTKANPRAQTHSSPFISPPLSLQPAHHGPSAPRLPGGGPAGRPGVHVFEVGLGLEV